MNEFFKYRAWDKFNGEMCEVRGINLVEGRALCCPLRPGAKVVSYRWRDINDFEFMQFTGMQDKNGKDIYAGDVCRCKGFVPENQEVRFIEGDFCLWFGEDNYPTDINIFYPSNGCQLEIIGNKYENPELLLKT